MNRNCFVYLALGAMTLCATTGCNNDKPEKQIAVNLNANISKSTTKVLNDQWQEQDKVGLFMKKAGQSLTAFGVVYSDANNAEMSIAGQALVTNPPVMYPGNGNVDFIAYYPYTATVGNDYTIAIDLADQTAGLATELLYSDNVTNQEATEATVMLNFRYSLSKVEIIVTCDELTPSDFAAMTASIEVTITQAKFRLADGDLSGDWAIQPIKMYKKGNTTTSATFEALVVPGPYYAFVFYLNDKEYRYEEYSWFYPATLYRIDFALCSGTGPIIEPTVISVLNASIEERQVEEYKMGVYSKECEILSFVVNGVEWQRSWGSWYFSHIYPQGTDLSSLTPVIEISPKATITPASGIPQDFSDGKTVTYVVTAENGTKRGYDAFADARALE